MKKAFTVFGARASRLRALALGSALALAAVVGFSMAACASTPKGAQESEPLAPDGSSGVIYFLQPTMRSGKADVHLWDSETPIGHIKGSAWVSVAYRVRPGTHYLMVKRFNWSKVKLDVRANNTYYFLLDDIINPIPFSKPFIKLQPMPREEGQQEFQKRQIITFSDDWRKEFKSGLSEEFMAEVRAQVAEARKL